MEYKLCYVNHGYAWFAPYEPTKIYGDDWNDAPYEHNASSPYGYDDDHKLEVAFIKIVYESDHETPADKGYPNSRYSVEDINQKHVAWLAHSDFPPIFAGVSIDEFCNAIWKTGGAIYMLKEPPNAE